MCVKYEDLVEEPRRTIAQIVTGIGEAEPKLDFITGAVYRADRPGHAVSGNPVRFARGEIEIRLDIEWLKNMSFKQKVIVAMLTFPLLVRYGYKIVPSG